MCTYNLELQIFHYVYRITKHGKISRFIVVELDDEFAYCNGNDIRLKLRKQYKNDGVLTFVSCNKRFISDNDTYKVENDELDKLYEKQKYNQN